MENEEEDDTEEKQNEEEAAEDGDLVENFVLEKDAMDQVQVDINNVMEDSQSHPITFGGLLYCNIAESVLKKLSPLEQLTKEELRYGFCKKLL